MQIEVRNLIFIAIGLLIIGTFFLLRKKPIVFFIILGLAIVCILKATQIGYAISQAKNYANTLIENTKEDINGDDGSLDADIDIDAEGIKESVGDAVDEALPEDLYVIDESRKGFGLDRENDDIVEHAEEVIGDFIGDTNK